MIQRDRSNTSSHMRIGDYLLPLQVVLLMASGFLILIQISEQPTSLPSRRLRQVSSTLTVGIDSQQRKALIEDLRKLYEGSRLEKSHVQQVFREGKKLLSEYDTIYNLPLPKIEKYEDADSSRKGITVRFLEYICMIRSRILSLSYSADE